MPITAADIQQAIARRFDSHKYDLMNSYIFNGWECDFFSVTTTGYCYEVEIKISRSDFFADFKKEKHNLFERLLNKQTFYFKNLGLNTYTGTFLAEYDTFELYNRVTGYRNQQRKDKNIRVEETATHQDYINHYENFQLRRIRHRIHAPCTNIQYIDLTKVLCPNRFFYAIPKGLIALHEIPKHAGLIYVDGYETTMIRQAPLLHNRLLDIKHILLDKFYYETKQLRQRVAYYSRQNETYDQT